MFGARLMANKNKSTAQNSGKVIRCVHAQKFVREFENRPLPDGPALGGHYSAV